MIEVAMMRGRSPVEAALPPEYSTRPRDFFAYSVEYNTLAANAVAAPQQFTVQNDSDFLVLSVSWVLATAAAGTVEQTYPGILVRILDSASGAAWMDRAVHLCNIAGSMGIDRHGPHVLIVPRLVHAGAMVTVEASNLEAVARRLWLTFHGCKIFRGMR